MLGVSLTKILRINICLRRKYEEGKERKRYLLSV